MTFYIFNGEKVKYREYGGGAEIVCIKTGDVVADFPCHLDAEWFLGFLKEYLE